MSLADSCIWVSSSYVDDNQMIHSSIGINNYTILLTGKMLVSRQEDNLQYLLN